MPSKFIALTVRPNESCKIDLPPCSALDIKHAALATDGKPSERCVLECELATHSFVLCSIPPNGPLQASLGTVITNDPAQAAWMFLRARGSCSFHVIGRMEIDVGEDEEPPPKKVAKSSNAARPAAKPTGAAVDLTDSGWALDAPKSSDKDHESGDAPEAMYAGSGNEVADIEVLLPEGEALEYPSDADSEGFIRFMQAKPKMVTAGKAPGGRDCAARGWEGRAAARCAEEANHR